MGRVVAGETSTTMKVLAILFLATLAYAAPEAEPKADADAAADAWYAYYGHPYRYYGYGGYYGRWYGYPYRYWWKRSAEAADPRAPLTSELQGVQKREAEAEASPESWYYGYYGHPYRYYGWGGYYRGYYGYPYRYWWK